MKKPVCFLIGLTLLVASSAAPVGAKKKSAQQSVTFYLRRDGANCDPESLFLSIVDAEDIDAGSCGNSSFGIPAMILTVNPLKFTTRAGDGVPFKLDTTKEITGTIGVKSSSQGVPARVGFGSTTLHVELSGVTKGKSKMIAEGDFDYLVVPGTSEQVYEVAIALAPDVVLHRAVFDSLTISLRNNGASFFHGLYTTDNPASKFTVGIWK